jgi:long-chain fatty acid transport protein
MKKYKWFIAVVCAAGVCQDAFAVGSGGFTNQAPAAKPMGMANAVVATADDSSAVFYNPAGLTQMESAEMSMTTSLFFIRSQYRKDDGATTKMKKETQAVPALSASLPLPGRRFAAGLGVNFPYGLATRWPDDGPFRYVATESAMRHMQINPSLAYKVNDRLSFGVGAAYSNVAINLKSRLNVTALNGGFPSPDGKKELDGDGSGWGYNVGVLFKPHERHRFGASYRSEIKTTIEGDARLSDLSGPASLFVFNGADYRVDAETVIKFPASLILGYAYAPGAWTFEADAEWVGYSSVDKIDIRFKGESDATRQLILNAGNPTPMDWKDTWNLGLGANYKFNDAWQARGGYTFFPPVVPEATWSPSALDSAKHGFSLGGSYAAGKSFSIDLGYAYILHPKRAVHNDVGATSFATVNGEYESSGQMITTGITYRFN